jgi:hypothetical protein
VPSACAEVQASTGPRRLPALAHIAAPGSLVRRPVSLPVGIGEARAAVPGNRRAHQASLRMTYDFGRNHRHASRCRRPTGHPASTSRVRHHAGGLPLTRGCGALARAAFGTWGRSSTCGPGPKSLPTPAGANGGRNPPRVEGARSTVAGRPLPNPTHEQGLSPSCTLASPLAAGVGPPVTPGIAPGGSRVRNTPSGRAAREGMLQK